MATAPRFQPGGSGIPRTRFLPPVRSFVRPLRGQDTTYYLSGVTRDASGTILASCTVWLFDSATQILQQTCTSSDAGAFAFKGLDPTKTYFVVAQKHAPSAYDAMVIADGASNYWKFNETSGLTFTDSIGGAVGTSPSGTGITYGVAGGPGGSTGLAIAGASVCPISPTIAGVGSFTIEVWAKPSGLVGPPKGPLFFSDQVFAFGTPSGLGIQNDINSDGLQSLFWFDALNGSQISTTPLVTGTTYHLAFVVTDSGGGLGVGVFFVNGVATTSTHDLGIVTGLAFDAMFTAPLQGAASLNLFDDLAFYPTALSAPTLLNHYTNRNAVSGSAYCGVTLDTLAGSAVLD